MFTKSNLKHAAVIQNTYRLQFSYLITSFAKLLQHLMQLLLHGLTINSFILKILGRELDLKKGRYTSGEHKWKGFGLCNLKLLIRECHNYVLRTTQHSFALANRSYSMCTDYLLFQCCNPPVLFVLAQKRLLQQIHLQKARKAHSHI